MAGTRSYNILFNKWSQLILSGRLSRGEKLGKKAWKRYRLAVLLYPLAGILKVFFRRVKNSTPKYLILFTRLHIFYNIVYYKQ